MIARILIGAAVGLTLSGAALAQSYNAPAGIPAATAPGGLEGQAAGGNAARYFRGSAQPAVPGDVWVDGIYTTGSVPAAGAPRRPAR